MTLDPATDGEVFVAYVKRVLVPNLLEGDAVVMNNLAVDTKAEAAKKDEAQPAPEDLPPEAVEQRATA